VKLTTALVWTSPLGISTKRPSEVSSPSVRLPQIVRRDIRWKVMQDNHSMSKSDSGWFGMA